MAKEFIFSRKADVQKFCKRLRKQFLIPVVDGKCVQIYKPASLREPERVMQQAENIYNEILSAK